MAAQMVKNLPSMQETWVHFLGWEDPWAGKIPGEGNGYPLQYSGLENFMDSTIHGVAKSWTQLSDFHFHFLSFLEKLLFFICESGSPRARL